MITELDGEMLHVRCNTTIVNYIQYFSKTIISFALRIVQNTEFPYLKHWFPVLSIIVFIRYKL